MQEPTGTTLLVILDGWGYRESSEHNALQQAQTPFWDRAWKEKPRTLIHTSGMAVGLPEGQMGNSEVGHMNLGAGRILYQSLTRIGKDIEAGRFSENEAIATSIDAARDSGGAVHIMGLLSPGGVHSHEDHLLAACDAAASRGIERIYLHAFLDGRDTPPRSAKDSIRKAQQHLEDLGKGRLVSLCGRYYAMDRDERWDRVQKAYRLLTEASAERFADDGISGLEAAYEAGENDEFVKPTWIGSREDGFIQSGDTVLFMNFRADRARQLSRCFTEPDFQDFEREQKPDLAAFMTLTEYSEDLDAKVAYPPESPRNGIGEYLGKTGKKQLRIAETEKYAHVTFFFSCGREQEYEGETRILVPSPKVATYDLQPEMSAAEVTDRLVDAIEAGSYDLIVVNYANCDMVGHTGDFNATVKACETIDQCLSRLDAAISKTGSQCLITADHGNAEMMIDGNDQPHTQHTTGPVPLLYLGPQNISLKDDGRLCDVAPSLLDLMHLDKPEEMSGHSLILRES